MKFWIFSRSLALSRAVLPLLGQALAAPGRGWLQLWRQTQRPLRRRSEGTVSVEARSAHAWPGAGCWLPPV